MFIAHPTASGSLALVPSSALAPQQTSSRASASACPALFSPSSYCSADLYSEHTDINIGDGYTIAGLRLQD